MVKATQLKASSIEQIKQLLKQKNNPVVGHEINGDSITRKQLIKRIEEAEKTN